MSAGWVAGGLRSRLLARRRVGRAGARMLAAEPTVPDAVSRLCASPYGRDVRPGMLRSEAVRAVGSTCLWDLRVVAGWLPPRGGGAVRVFAARFELENVADHFATVRGVSVPAPYELGALAVAWPRLRTALTLDDLHAALRRSPWGDAGSTEWSGASPTLRARWATWLADAVPECPAWASGAAGLVVAQEVEAGRELPDSARTDLRGLLGSRWEAASDLGELADALPSSASWVLDGIDEREDLWLAEGRWWRRLDGDAERTLGSGRSGRAMVAAAAARLVADVWHVQAGLEAAGRGEAGVEVFDAVA